MESLVYTRLLWYVTLNAGVFAFILLFTPLRFRKSACIAFACVVLLAIAGLDFLRFSPFVPTTNRHFIAITFIEILFVQAFAVSVSKYRDGRSLFTGLSASNLVLTGYIFGTVVGIYTDSPLLNLLTSTLVNVALLVFLTVFTRNKYLALQQKSKSGWLPLCMIPICYYLIFYFLTSVPETLAEKPYDIPAALFAVGGMVISYVVASNYVLRQAEEDEVSRNKVLLEAYMKSLSVESAAIEQAQGELAILRHDMRHYVGMISVMLDAGDYDGVRQILGQANTMVAKTEVPIYCGNAILNSTMQSLALRADREGIFLKSSILVGTGDDIPYIEFSAVVANLVENALIATGQYSSGEKSVSILVQPVKNQLVVEVKNPTEHQIEIDSKTGLPKTIPADMHGIGLKSVRDFVERNQGMFCCSCENYVFTARLSVSLQP